MRRITTELFVGKQPGRVMTRFHLDETAKQEYCILIVDDESVTQKLYKDILTSDGYLVKRKKTEELSWWQRFTLPVRPKLKAYIQKEWGQAFKYARSDEGRNAITFYEFGKMPCCGKEVKFYEGPRGGMCTNIKCVHCGHEWNICTQIKFIEDIGKKIFHQDDEPEPKTKPKGCLVN